MADQGFTAIGTEPSTIKTAEDLAERLSGSGMKFTKAAVLRAAVVIGLEEIERNPNRLVSPGRNRKRASA